MTWTVLYSIQDEKGAVSTTELNLPANYSLADANAFATEGAKLINALITGAITRIGISKAVELPGTLRAAALSGSDVEEGARFQFKTENGFYSSMRLATFDESKVIGGTREVDQADSAVAAFTGAMVSGLNLVAVGGTLASAEPCDKRGEDLTSLEFAREQFLSSRG